LIDRVTLRCPLNSTSLGNVSYNFLKELYKKGVKVSLLPVQQKADLSSYDSITEDFKDWIAESVEKRFDTIRRSNPFINLWHINGSDAKVADKNLLYTFYEANAPTPQEINLVNLYDKVCFSSEHAAKVFAENKAENCSAIPLGFDSDLFRTGKEYLTGKIHFGLMGKWERRKHTTKIIQTWLKAYGNNFDFQLTCCVNNAFLNQSEMSALKSEALMGKNFGNINFLPWLAENSQVNDYLNSIDIDLGGASGAEGWNLPCFNAACLGKWPIVLNSTSHKDWATEENSILMQPSGDQDITDGKFFINDSGFNQGTMSTFSEKDLLNSMEKAADKVWGGETNGEGVKLGKKFTYEKTINKIFDKFVEIS
jgi:hypothetical protein